MYFVPFKKKNKEFGICSIKYLKSGFCSRFYPIVEK